MAGQMGLQRLQGAVRLGRLQGALLLLLLASVMAQRPPSYGGDTRINSLLEKQDKRAGVRRLHPFTEMVREAPLGSGRVIVLDQSHDTGSEEWHVSPGQLTIRKAPPRAKPQSFRPSRPLASPSLLVKLQKEQEARRLEQGVRRQEQGVRRQEQAARRQENESRRQGELAEAQEQEQGQQQFVQEKKSFAEEVEEEWKQFQEEFNPFKPSKPRR